MSAASAKPRVVIPVYHEFDLLDVCGPAEIFSWAQYQVDLVADQPGAIKANNGFELMVSAGLGVPSACDVLWVPGGAPQMLDTLMYEPAGQRYRNFLVAQAKQAKWVCSVCEGALLLAAVGLLDGCKATTHWAFIPYLMAHFPKVKIADGHPRFVVDGHRVTGGGISSGLDESLKLVELISGPETAQGVQQSTQYYPEPPVSSDIPNVITSPMMPPRPLPPKTATH